MSLETILRENGYTLEDVRQYLKERNLEGKIPMDTAIKVFLRSKGIDLFPQPVEVKTIISLVVDEWATIEAYYVTTLRERAYIGCPNCLHRIDNVQVGVSVECPFCSEMVTVERLTWREALFTDATGELTVLVSPRLKDVVLEPGKLYRVRGVLDNTNVFNAREIKVMVEAKTFKCKVCGRVLPSKEALEQHLREGHGIYSPVEEETKEEKPVEKREVEAKPKVTKQEGKEGGEVEEGGKEKSLDEIDDGTLEKAKGFIKLRATYLHPTPDRLRKSFLRVFKDFTSRMYDELIERMIDDGEIDLDEEGRLVLPVGKEGEEENENA